MDVITYLPWINLIYFVTGICIFYTQARGTGNLIKNSIIYGIGASIFATVVLCFVELLIYVMYDAVCSNMAV